MTFTTSYCLHSATVKPHSARGFTLIEIMLVMFIIGLTAAVVFPKMGIVGGGNLDAEIRTLSGHIQGLYSEATFKRRMHRLAFNLDADRYWAEVELGGGYSPVQRNFLKPVQLPHNIHLMDVLTTVDGKRTDGTAYAYFHPLGRVDRVIIHLQANGTDTMTLQVNPVTGRVALKEGYVEDLFG